MRDEWYKYIYTIGITFSWTFKREISYEVKRALTIHFPILDKSNRDSVDYEASFWGSSFSKTGP